MNTNWFKEHPAFAALLGLVAVLALLRLTGRLSFQKRGDSHAVKPATQEQDKDPVADPAPTSKIVLDLATARDLGLQSVPAAKEGIAVSVRANGEVRPSEDHKLASLAPRIPGVVRELHAGAGDRVIAGALLCVIESAELGEARAAYATAFAEKSFAERNHERWKTLYEKGLRTQTEYWAAENEFNKAKISLESAASRLRALGQTGGEIAALGKGGSRAVTSRYELRSPIAGRVLERKIALGAAVEPKDTLFIIADLSEVWVQAAIHENELAGIRSGAQAAVRTQSTSGGVFFGSVASVGQQLSEGSRTAMVRIVVKNGVPFGGSTAGLLLPGMFVAVEIETSRKASATVVPPSAVQEIAGKPVVFVETLSGPDSQSATSCVASRSSAPAGCDEKAAATTRQKVIYERREVTLGDRDAKHVEVIKGIAPGERVVSENAYLLKSEFEKAKIAGED